MRDDERQSTLAIIQDEIVPQAATRHLEVLRDIKVTAQTLNRAIEMAYKYALADPAGGPEKQAHEMSAEELAQAIAALERVASNRAKPVRRSTSPDNSIFD